MQKPPWMKFLLQVYVDAYPWGLAGVPTAQLGDSLPGRRAVATGQADLCSPGSDRPEALTTCIWTTRDISLCVGSTKHLPSSVGCHLPW